MRNRNIKRMKIIMFKGRNTKPCKYCGKRLTMQSATFDHVKPKSKGGYDRLKNGAIACGRCNNLKRSMSVSEFKLFMQSQPKQSTGSEG